MEGKGPPGSSGERERGRARAEPHCSEEAVPEASPGAGVQTEYLWPQGSGGPAVELPAGPFPQGRSQDSQENASSHRNIFVEEDSSLLRVGPRSP